MKLGYADPPYPGCAHLYKDHPDFAGEVDHAALIARLEGEFDGWVLHTNATPSTLRLLAPLVPDSARWMSWVKGFAAFKKNVSVAYAWEPVIVKPARKPVADARGGNVSDLFPLQTIDPADDAKRILQQAIAEYSPRKIILGFSGGNDSLAVGRMLEELDVPFIAMHIDTTIGIPAARDHVEDTVRQRGWKLKVYKPPVSYDEIVLEHGFPGPGQHNTTYARLKERCIRQMRREHQEYRGERVMLVTGVRKAESKRRMGTVQEIQREGSLVWVAPATNWTTEQRDDYLTTRQCRRSPVSAAICMSGECVCGSSFPPAPQVF